MGGVVNRVRLDKTDAAVKACLQRGASTGQGAAPRAG